MAKTGKDFHIDNAQRAYPLICAAIETLDAALAEGKDDGK